MNATRVSCSVLTCDRDMPAGQVMCSWCWAKVPADLRRKLDKIKLRVEAGRQRRELERQAVSAAQAVRS